MLHAAPQKPCPKFKKGCILTEHNFNSDINISVSTSWSRLGQLRRCNINELQKQDAWKKHLATKYGCVPGLKDSMFALTWDVCRKLDVIPDMTITTSMMKDMALRTFNSNGISHQCNTRQSTTPSLLSPTANLLCRDRKRVLLRQFVEKRIIDNINSPSDETNIGELPVGLLQIHRLLCYMRHGRIEKALEKVSAHWTFTDCLRILEVGMYVYFETRQNYQQGDLAIQLSIAKMIHERVHERYVEPEHSHVEDLHMMLSNSSSGLPSSPALPDFPSPFKLDEAFYEPVFVNSWFFWMQESFRLTEKIFVSTNDDRSNHLAYVICYHNSFQMRKIMHKSYPNDMPTVAGRPIFDKDNKVNWYPQFKHNRHDDGSVDPGPCVVRPHCFVQMTDGPCLTLALFNFVANKGDSPITKQILENVSSHTTAVENDRFLRSLHQYILCGRYNNDDDYTPTVSCPGDSVAEGNHIVLITNINGYVWEIDGSEDGCGTLCLGREGSDWTRIAQGRLEQWTHAAWETQVHNDVHAIIIDH